MSKKHCRQKIIRPTRKFQSVVTPLQSDISKKPTAWLIFSKEEKEFARKIFGDRGFNLALNDNGKAVPYTVCTGSLAELRNLLKKYPDSEVLPVRELRIVQSMHGQPANKDKWREWGYTPQVNSELSCNKHVA